MSPHDEIIEIKGSATKLMALLLCGVLMFALCASIAFGYLPVDAGSKEEFAAWAGLVLFGFGILAFTRGLLSVGTNVISISPSGYLDTRISARPIPWDSIEDVLVWSTSGSNIIVLQVSPEAEKSVGLTSATKRSRRSNAMFGVTGLTTMAAGLAISHKELLAVITERVNYAQMVSSKAT